MKQYIKDDKIYNSPVVIVINGRKITSNSDSYLAKFGYEPYVAPPVSQTEQIEQEPEITLTTEQKIEESDRLINAQTDDKILNDFIYDGQEFYLTTENQINFSNMFTAREFLDYPQTVKTKDGFYELVDQAKVEDFYLTGIQFVKHCLEEGWTRKEAAKQEILEAEE